MELSQCFYVDENKRRIGHMWPCYEDFPSSGVIVFVFYISATLECQAPGMEQVTVGSEPPLISLCCII